MLKHGSASSSFGNALQKQGIQAWKAKFKSSFVRNCGGDNTYELLLSCLVTAWTEGQSLLSKRNPCSLCIPRRRMQFIAVVPVGTDVLKAAPVAFRVLPQHQVHVQQLDLVWLITLEVLCCSNRVPLVIPVKLVLGLFLFSCWNGGMLELMHFFCRNISGGFHCTDSTSLAQ